LSVWFTKSLIRDDALMLDVTVAVTMTPGPRSDTSIGTSGTF